MVFQSRDFLTAFEHCTLRRRFQPGNGYTAIGKSRWYKEREHLFLPRHSLLSDGMRRLISTRCSRLVINLLSRPLPLSLLYSSDSLMCNDDSARTSVYYIFPGISFHVFHGNKRCHRGDYPTDFSSSLVNCIVTVQKTPYYLIKYGI